MKTVHSPFLSQYFAMQSSLLKILPGTADAGVLLATLALTVLLPVPAMALLDRPPASLFRYPPVYNLGTHGSLHWPIFIAIAMITAAVVVPPAVRLVAHAGTPRRRIPPRAALPWWGFTGMATGVAFWWTAWTSVPALSAIRPHTFLLLWLSYILLLDALCFRRTGTSPISRLRFRFLLLFPLSAVFWWTFEHLNRFVENWVYLSIEQYSTLQYILLASFSYATVIPTVFVTREWLGGFASISEPFSRWFPIRPARSRFPTILLVAVAFASLFFLPLYPNLLFPFVWLSPLALLCGLASLCGRKNIFSSVTVGDWREIVLWSAAGLLCGAIWELWNYHSLAKWIYQVPHVDAFRIFEMPLLGYAGYIPFGILCGSVSRMFMGNPGNPGSTVLPGCPERTGDPRAITPPGGPAFIETGSLPRHLAFIMDGNGRWAEQQRLPRTEGHRAGTRVVDMVVERSRTLGIRHLTLFAFSSENWQRPASEVSVLMKLFARFLKQETDRLIANGIRLRGMGDLERLPAAVLSLLKEAEEATAHQDGMDLQLAISYGGRGEITQAARRIARLVAEGKKDADRISENDISRSLYLPDLPDPDLVIRTGNEYRLSNFLLWQAAYAEIMVSPVPWPDFTPHEFDRCLAAFAGRERRFGRTGSQCSHVQEKVEERSPTTGRTEHAHAL